MGLVRRFGAVIAASGLAVVGMTVATGAPAGAANGDTSVVCTPGVVGGAPFANCTVSDPDGIQTIAVKVAEPFFNQTVVTEQFACGTDAPTSFNFNIIAGDRYKVFVTDCQKPRDKSTWVIRANGATP